MGGLHEQKHKQGAKVSFSRVLSTFSDNKRLKVGAETIAEVLNQLVDPLSYKTMFFGALLFIGSLFAASSAIGKIWGAKLASPSHSYPPPPPARIQVNRPESTVVSRRNYSHSSEDDFD